MAARTDASVSEVAAPQESTPLPPHPSRGDIRVVAFDCYGTLLDFDERSFAPAIDDLLRAQDIHHTDGEAVWKAWLEHAREHAKKNGRDPDKPLAGPEPPFLTFAETWTQHFQHAFRQTEVQGVDAGCATDYVFQLLSQAPLYEEVTEVLTTLRDRGLRLVVASNADNAHLNPALEQPGIREHLELIISSETVRSYKPRRPFFDAIEQRTGAASHQILYVGDSPYSDITGARNAGMAAYWVRRYHDEEREKHLHHEPTWRFPDLCGLLGLLPGGAE